MGASSSSSVTSAASSFIGVLLLVCLLSGGEGGGVGGGVNNTLCSSKERQALMDLKQGLTDPFKRLSSWSPNRSDDCCQWEGVRCHNLTGAVTELHLQNPLDPDLALGGHISPSLLQLESLSYLDLSDNDFQGTPIPSFLGSLTSLRYLNLFGASFGGLVPGQHLQNLSSIRHLDLGTDFLPNRLRMDSLGWIGHLRSLEYLRLYRVDLSSSSTEEVDWFPQVVSMLPSLSELHLSDCKLCWDRTENQLNRMRKLDRQK